MAVPKQKKSRSNSRSRRAQWKATAPKLVACSRCHDMKRQHTVCHTCGTYDGRQVLQPS